MKTEFTTKEINEKYSDKVIRSNFWKNQEQFISNNEAVRSKTKYFNSQAEKWGKSASVLPSFKKAYDLKSDNIVELSTKEETLKNRNGSFDA